MIWRGEVVKLGEAWLTWGYGNRHRSWGPPWFRVTGFGAQEDEPHVDGSASPRLAGCTAPRWLRRTPYKPDMK